MIDLPTQHIYDSINLFIHNQILNKPNLSKVGYSYNQANKHNY